MLIPSAIVIVAAVCVDRQGTMRRFASTTVVQIVPATPKHRMDEQRRAQQCTGNRTHHILAECTWRAAEINQPLGIYLIQTFVKPDRFST
jgi:hypothetical protein